MKKRIPINTKDSIYFIVPDEVVYCKSEQSSTTIFLENNEQVSISREINDIEKLLEGNNFIRPHQSYLVNRDFVKLVDIANDYTLVLTTLEKIPTSAQMRKEIMDIILKIQNSKES
jgi:two-component system LytT family response regulator